MRSKGAQRTEALSAKIHEQGKKKKQYNGVTPKEIM
jgi:hypothetical protein